MSTGSSLFLAGAVLVAVALFAPSLDGPEPEPSSPSDPTEAAASAPARAGNGLASQELKRAPDGHFYAEAQVNGARIRFLIDTGASVVALTPADAQRAGIARGHERATVIGAGGRVEVVPVTIDRIAVGPLSTTAVRGAIADGLPVSLLGQSFLSRVGSVEIRGDRMVLR